MSNSQGTNENRPTASLVLENRNQPDKTPVIGGVMMLTPNVGEDYWTYRVRLSEKQAVIGFPKFGGIGIGFAVEEDWNTNFPYTVDAEETFEHIKHNKGDDTIADEDVLEAIRMVQDAAWRDNGIAKLADLAERLLHDPDYVNRAHAERVIRNIRERFCGGTR